MNNYLKFSFVILVPVLFVISVLSGNHIHDVKGECAVSILSDNAFSNLRYPGQQSQFSANVSGTEDNNINYTWSVDGPIIKSYDNRADDPLPSQVDDARDLKDPKPMTQSDYKSESIDFVWLPNKTDNNRTVAVEVQTSDDECAVSEDFIVEKNINDTNFQVEDFYLGYIVPSFGNSEIESSEPLREHMLWHIKYGTNAQNYSGKVFFGFHKAFLDHFDAFRNLTGYDNITQWNPWNSSMTQSNSVEVDHSHRLVNGNLYEHDELPNYFKLYQNGDGPDDRPITKYRDGSTLRDRPCEEVNRPTDPIKIPQDALNDFESNLELLGCAITIQYHGSIHTTTGQWKFITEEEAEHCLNCKIIKVPGDLPRYFGDLSRTDSAPRDPLFWKLHKFIDNVADNRTELENAITANSNNNGSSAVARETPPTDLTSPSISFQIPYILEENEPGLPTITEEFKDIFNSTGAEYISVEFSEPVKGVLPGDLKVNGTSAKMVNGSGAGPYVFVGFEPPSDGPLNVTLTPSNITDLTGNSFEGESWNYNLFDEKEDSDRDGIQDGIEVQRILGDPTKQDTDGDTIPDGFEATATTCLDPLVNDAIVMDINENIISTKGIDTDGDGVSNVDEFYQGTDPCIKPMQTQTEMNTTFLSGNVTLNISPSSIQTILDTSPFILYLKTTGGITGVDNLLSYNSFTKEAISINNNNETKRQISQIDEGTSIRILDNSGYFDSDSFYPPLPNSTDYSEYTLVTVLGNNIHALSWTDTSEGVPDAIGNLPFALNNLLGPQIQSKVSNDKIVLGH